MNWTGTEIRQLRYRMGWSQAEMARCLKLEPSMMSDLEAGSQELPVETRSSLIRIFHQAEQSSDRVLRRPVADVLMRDLGLSQIHDLDVIEKSSK